VDWCKYSPVPDPGHIVSSGSVALQSSVSGSSHDTVPCGACRAGEVGGLLQLIVDALLERQHSAAHSEAHLYVTLLSADTSMEEMSSKT
jgi:hypothetical protein